MTNFSIIEQTKKLVLADQTEPIIFKGKKLQNACFFPAKADFHIPKRFWQTTQNSDIRNEILKEWKTGPVGVGYVYAGWGHAVEAYAQAQSLARMGMPVILFDALELLPKFVRAITRFFLKTNEFAQQIKITKVIKNEPQISEKNLRRMNKFFRFAEGLLGKYIVDFINYFQLSHISASHPFPISVLQKQKIPILDNSKFYLSQWIPDHYGPASLAYAVIRNPLVYHGVFDKKAKEILTQIFQIPSEKVTVWGNQLNPEAMYLTCGNSHYNILKNNQEKIAILLTTGGAGGEYPILKRFIQDFAPELLKKNSKYHFVVFTGHHKKLIRKIKYQIKKNQLNHSPNIEVFTCHSLLEVAAYRSILPGLCQVIGAKSGEPALQVGLGYCYISFGPFGLHERYNEDYALKTTQAGLKLPDAKINLLEWFNNLAEKNILAHCSQNGFKKARSYNIFEYALWVREQIIKKLKVKSQKVKNQKLDFSSTRPQKKFL